MSDPGRQLPTYTEAAAKLSVSAEKLSEAIPQLVDRIERLENQVVTLSDTRLKSVEILIASEVRKLELCIESEVQKLRTDLDEVLPSVRREVDRVETTNKQVLEAIESRLQGVRDSLDGLRTGSDAGFQGLRDSLVSVRQSSEALTGRVESQLSSLATKDDLGTIKEDIAALKATSIRPVERITFYIASLTAVVTLLGLVISAVSIWGAINSISQQFEQQLPNQQSTPQQPAQPSKAP